MTNDETPRDMEMLAFMLLVDALEIDRMLDRAPDLSERTRAARRVFHVLPRAEAARHILHAAKALDGVPDVYPALLPPEPVH